jgi:hypothetical protein
MLNEITRDEFEQYTHRRKKVTPDKVFALDAVREFMASDAEVCEVTGWPSGVPTEYAKATAQAQALRSAAAQLGVHRKMKVKQRRMRVFMVKEVPNG